MSKNIVICSDGTGQNGLKDTNVSRLFTVLDLSDPSAQVGCYDAGVGAVPISDITRTVARRGPGNVVVRPSPPMGPVGRFAGLAVGYGLYQNVRELYQILVDYYRQGDRVYLFGFSRGAFTVRVLAGLIYRCGILLPQQWKCFDEAFKLYEPHYEALPDNGRRLRANVDRFRASFARGCDEITFLGIWDTVKAVGYFWPQSLPHTRRNPLVKTVRHALALDESRSFFVPTTWGGLDSDTQPPTEGQDVQEVWFPGGHSDVGGGYSESENGLAQRPLEWMIKEASICHLRIDHARASELRQRLSSATTCLHDELTKATWRITEILPRWELQNDPPPPRRVFRWGPSGKRAVLDASRGGAVRIDSSAEESRHVTAQFTVSLDASVLNGRVQFVDTCADIA